MFGKKGVDLIDYTLLEKKGFIKKKEESSRKVEVSRDGYLKLNETDLDEILGTRKLAQNVNSLSNSSEVQNFTALPESQKTSDQNDQSTIQIAENKGINNFESFFESNSATSSVNQLTNPNLTNSSNRLVLSEAEILDLKNLKSRYEDLEYKFDRLAEKFESIAVRLLEMESRLK